MRYFEEFLYLVALAVAITLLYKGLNATSKAVIIKAPFVPDGLKEFAAA